MHDLIWLNGDGRIGGAVAKEARMGWDATFAGELIR